jgi:glycosyltransferase involved in cell wall biosynthesis
MAGWEQCSLERRKALSMTKPANQIDTLPQSVSPDRVLVFIPAYNEEGSIRNVVTGVQLAVPDADVLVVDDGSSDHTASEARATGAIIVRHPFNLGIGGAMQTGLKYAEQFGYDYAIRLDGDGQHSTVEILHFLEVLRAGDTDMVIGSRFLESSYDWDIPRSRWIGIRLYSAAVSAVTGARSTDTTSGFCGMNRQAICVLAKYLPQDYPDVESRVIVHKAGLGQLELPVQMHARTAGVSSINLWKSIYYAFKVTVAVLTSAIKDIAHFESLVFHPKDYTDGDTVRAKTHSSALQSYTALGDAPTDP